MARLSIWEASEFAILIRRTSRTDETLASCGDLFTRLGGGPPLTGNDIVGPAIEAEDFFALTSLGPTTGPNIRKLTELRPTTLALMHGSAFQGDTVGALDALADRFEARLQAAMTR